MCFWEETASVRLLPKLVVKPYSRTAVESSSVCQEMVAKLEEAWIARLETVGARMSTVPPAWGDGVGKGLGLALGEGLGLGLGKELVRGLGKGDGERAGDGEGGGLGFGLGEGFGLGKGEGLKVLSGLILSGVEGIEGLGEGKTGKAKGKASIIFWLKVSICSFKSLAPA